MNKKRYLITLPYFLWIIFLVILPILLVFVQSFLDPSNHFTIENYKTFFSPIYLQMTFNSFLIAFLITIICLIVAYPIAYLISKRKHQKLLLMLFVLPSWVNLLLKAYAFMGLLATDGLLNQFIGIFGVPPIQFLFDIKGFLIVSVYIFLPFMLLPIYNSITQIDDNVIIAAQDLGANSFDVFKRIIFPLSKSGIISGLQVVFIPSLSLFMLTRLIAGNQIITLGTAIEQHFLVTGNWGMGSTIGVFLILILILSMFITQRFTKKKTIDFKGGANA